MIVSAETLVALQTTFRALFATRTAAVTPQWPTIAMEAPSTNRAENYQWLGAVPAMKEWIDERTREKLLGFQYTVTNKSWEATLEVDRDDIEDDQLGIYRPQIEALADEGVRHPDELMFLLLMAGQTNLCYDGQFFFDTDHAEGLSGAQSNLLTGTGVTVAQVTADFIAARSAMRLFKNDRGKPWLRGEPKFVIVAPPAMEGVFETVMNAALIAGGDTNTLKGAASIVINPYATDVNNWDLLHVGAPIKPLLLQMRRRPEFVALDSPTSEEVFRRKKFLYGVEGRYNGGYGLWQLAVRTTNT
jgi:phage major head subunit gpT-like protein